MTDHPAPLVTVGLPVRDGAEHLVTALDSLLGQTLEDIEVIVADNASTDATVEICRERAASDPRVRLVLSDVNRGAAWNYNRLVPLARGRYFTWAAHDDVRDPRALEACATVLDEDRGVVLAYPRTITIDGSGQVLDPGFVDDLDHPEPEPHRRLARYARHKGEQHAVFGVIRTSVLRRTRLIARCWGGDIPLLAELLLHGRFHEVPERLFLRRYHPGTSMLAHGDDAAAVVRWFDPRRGGRLPLPRTRLLGEVTVRLLTAPVPAPVRARSAAAFATGWTATWWRHMGGEVKRAARAACGGHYQSV